MLGAVPDHLKTRGMCNKAVDWDLYLLRYVPDHFKTQKMCEGVVKRVPPMLRHVLDWFVTRTWIDMWCDDDDLYDEG